MKLWSTNGFDTFETTTANEIAAAAGVSKGTFYFHFANREEVLLEMGLDTAQSMQEVADAGFRRQVPTLDVLEQVVDAYAKRIAKAPRGATYRIASMWPNTASTLTTRGIGVVMERLLHHGVSRRELPPDLEVARVAALLRVALLDAISRWAAGTEPAAELRRSLSFVTDVVLRGATARALDSASRQVEART